MFLGIVTAPLVLQENFVQLCTPVKHDSLETIILTWRYETND